jgi:hypothetical protein
MELVITTKDELRTLIKDSISAALATMPKDERRDDLPEWLTRKQVADYLNCSLATVDNYSREGLLIKVHVNGLPRFKREQVRQALEALQ